MGHLPYGGVPKKWTIFPSFPYLISLLPFPSQSKTAQLRNFIAKKKIRNKGTAKAREVHPIYYDFLMPASSLLIALLLSFHSSSIMPFPIFDQYSPPDCHRWRTTVLNRKKVVYGKRNGMRTQIADLVLFSSLVSTQKTCIFTPVLGVFFARFLRVCFRKNPYFTRVFVAHKRPLDRRCLLLVSLHYPA